METLFTEIVKQTPALGVVLIAFWLCLRHMEKRDAGRDGLIQKLHEEHLDARSASRDALLKSSEVNLKNVEVIGSLTTAIQILIERLRAHNK